MLIKVGKFGPFIACSGYPECTNTRELETRPESERRGRDEPCDNCGKPMVMKRGRFGQFLACSGYPECKTTRKLIATKQGAEGRQARPDSRREMPALQLESGRQAGPVRRVHRLHQLSRLQVHQAQVDRRRVSEGRRAAIVERKSKRGKMFFGCSNYPDCDFVLWNRPVAETCPKCAAPYLIEKTTKRHGRQILCNNEDCDYVRSEELPE